MSKKFLISAAILTVFFAGITAAGASGIIPSATGGSCSSGDADYCGNYELNDFIFLAINISKWILGIVGSLTLVMFVYGGFIFLISSGAAEKIQQAKKILIGSVIGLIIVFTSYMIIKFVMGSMGLQWSGKVGTTFSPCEETYGKQNYSCIAPDSGTGCMSGLCNDKTNAIQCCKPIQ